MNIEAHSTTVAGNPGNLFVRGIDFTSPQDVMVKLGLPNRRVVVKSITLLSKAVSALSAGASLTVAEAIATRIAATNTLTAEDPCTAGNVVNIGDLTYTLVDSLSEEPAAYEVVVGETAAETLTNLKAAINGDAEALDETISIGTDAHPDVIAGTLTVSTLELTAIVAGRSGNEIEVTTDEVSINPSAATFEGGLDGTEVNALSGAIDLSDDDEIGVTQELLLTASREVVADGNYLMLSISAGSVADTDLKDAVIEYVIID